MIAKLEKQYTYKTRMLNNSTSHANVHKANHRKTTDLHSNEDHCYDLSAPVQKKGELGLLTPIDSNLKAF